MILRILVFLAAILYGESIAVSVQDSTKASAKDSITAIKPTSERYLHVATNPTAADIYVNQSNIDFSAMPDYTSPDFVKIPQGDSIVQITLFQIGYNDTTINTTLSERDSSYLIVSLRQSYDDDFIDAQKKTLAHRKRKSLGHKLIWASLVPFAASAVSAIITQKFIQDARDDKESLENSIIRKGDSFQDKEDDFENNRSKAKTAKTIGGTSLGIGIAVLSAGIILSF